MLDHSVTVPSKCSEKIFSTKNCMPNLSIKCKIKLKPMKHARIKKFYLLYLVFYETTRRYPLATWRKKEENRDFRKIRTPTHENSEGKFRLTAMQQPRTQLIYRWNQEWRELQGGCLRAGAWIVLVFRIVYQYVF